MPSSSAFRWLILVLPVAWVIIRLWPAEHSLYSHLRGSAQSVHESPSHHKADQFTIHESLFKNHYQSHYAASPYDYNHYRPAYKYGFDLALDPDNQKIGWKSVAPQARHNWHEDLMGLWSQHTEAILYGWEQGITVHSE